MQQSGFSWSSAWTRPKNWQLADRFSLMRGRLLRDEALLATLSLSQDQLFARAEGRRIALVGNARSLAEQDWGERIDAADLVVRLNAAPIPSTTSHGSRTDWICASIPLPRAVLAARRPSIRAWLSPKRRRLPWHIARGPGFYLLPAEWQQRLAERLGSRPSTGALAIDLLLRSPAAQVTLYGFDFFASKSLSGSRDATQVPHDFAAEADWATALAAADPRLCLSSSAATQQFLAAAQRDA